MIEEQLLGMVNAASLKKVIVMVTTAEDIPIVKSYLAAFAKRGGLRFKVVDQFSSWSYLST